MDAIRNSLDKYRTLESFWKGQIRSKVWLVEQLQPLQMNDQTTISIHGGWHGVLASLLFNSNLKIDKIVSFDIDPKCEEIANTINKRQEMQGRFQAVTGDCTKQLYRSDITINTICEHLTQEQYDRWLNLVDKDSLVVLQGNNYFECDEHVRCAETLEEFEKQSNVLPVFKGSFNTPKYTRFMIIGYKNII